MSYAAHPFVRSRLRTRLVLVSSAFLSALSFVLVSANIARAEYRAYELTITNTQTGTARTVLTTLDDIQYPGYYHVARTETVAIRDTWMCWQRSNDFKPICPNPRAVPAPEAGQNPATPPGPTSNSTAPAPATP